MNRFCSLAVALVLSIAPGCIPSSPPKHYGSLSEARKGFKTRLERKVSDADRPYRPPENIFTGVRYPAPSGDQFAYISKHPDDGKKRPAIIWIHGGDCGSIGEVAWEPAQADNDQSARWFRQEGIVMMLPSLRGACGNPGYKEGFYGEVDDILAAADFLARQPNVDPDRIYLGGHSTGGTLALLVAECDPRFRAVFAFGPVADISGYGNDYKYYRDTKQENELRSPGRWLSSIHSPVFVFEGAQPPSNAESLQSMANASSNDLIKFNIIRDANHFSILSPATHLIAKKILRDTSGPNTNISFSKDDLDKMH
jgi:dipeptidyl aminopeptidase/acylaminoacyl peptidase